MTLLKVLDSIMKNIGEAVAVLAIYFMQIALPGFGNKRFESSTFLAMSMVVMTVTTYMFLKQDLDASKEKEKAAKAELAALKARDIEAEVWTDPGRAKSEVLAGGSAEVRQMLATPTQRYGWSGIVRAPGV